MNGNAARRASLVLGVTLLLGACGHQSLTANSDDDSGINAYPTNYKADILAAMHVYLNDPTGIRDAAVSPPALKQAGSETRYVACLKFNPKKNTPTMPAAKSLRRSFWSGGSITLTTCRKIKPTPQRTSAPARPIRRSRNCRSCRRDPAANDLESDEVYWP